MKKLNYKHTIGACFIAYMVQAIVCNFAPLLFVGWEREFSISISQLTFIVTITFLSQIIVDLISAKTSDKIGYKNSLIISHLCASTGFLLLGILPYVIGNKYVGIVIPVILYSIGSGILEVLISPVVEACPTDNKTGAMSLLHSFYCWGTVFVIGASTLFFVIIGREHWRYLSFLWAIFSFLNGVFFCFVPIKEPKSEPQVISNGAIFKSKFFYAAIVLMICAGASELAMSQWASTLAEIGLDVSKTVGDLAGPMAFAVLMGVGRIAFSKFSSKIKAEVYILFSAVICIVSYLITSLSKSAAISLVGCALCGLAVSAMWPATISLSTKRLKGGTTMMFGLLALAGDIGCTAGPTAIGIITSSLDGDLKKGLIYSIVFPIIIIVLSIFLFIKPAKRQIKRVQ